MHIYKFYLVFGDELLALFTCDVCRFVCVRVCVRDCVCVIVWRDGVACCVMSGIHSTQTKRIRYVPHSIQLCTNSE